MTGCAALATVGGVVTGCETGTGGLGGGVCTGVGTGADASVGVCRDGAIDVLLTDCRRVIIILGRRCIQLLTRMATIAARQNCMMALSKFGQLKVCGPRDRGEFGSLPIAMAISGKITSRTREPISTKAVSASSRPMIRPPTHFLVSKTGTGWVGSLMLVSILDARLWHIPDFPGQVK